MQMNFEEFWEYYLDNKIFMISDDIIDMFKQPISDEVYEKYDLGGIIADFTGHFELANNYEQIELFGEVLKQNQPKLYNKEGVYIIEGLVRYYCFKGDAEKLKIQLQDYITDNFDFDLMLLSFKLTAYYQHAEIANKFLEQIYEEFINSPKLIEGASYDLDMFKLHYELERLFKNNMNKSTIDLSHFKKKMNKYGFELDESNFEQSIEICLFNDSNIPLKQLLKELKVTTDIYEEALGLRFFKYMLTKKCSFSTSRIIWYNHLEYFNKINTKKQLGRFVFQSKSFIKFLASKTGFLLDNRPDVAAILWGSEYINEFLYEQQLISEKNYIKHHKAIKEVKQAFKKANKRTLWKFSFVHLWSPPNNCTPEEQAAEKLAFEASYELEMDTSKIVAPNEYDQLIENESLESGLEDSFFEKPQPEIERTYEVISSGETYVNPNKIGRNEKVNVKYTDGTVKKAVKYKKVMHDVESGHCEIIEATLD